MTGNVSARDIADRAIALLSGKSIVNNLKIAPPPWTNKSC